MREEFRYLYEGIKSRQKALNIAEQKIAELEGKLKMYERFENEDYVYIKLTEIEIENRELKLANQALAKECEKNGWLVINGYKKEN